MKKMIVFGIVIIMVLCSYPVISSPIFSINKTNQGRFIADIGFGDDEDIDLQLDGFYKMRGRIRFVSGSFNSTNNDREGRFYANFYEKTFFMMLFNRESRQIIRGRITVRDDYSAFSGNWRGRELRDFGWITGEFITRG